MAGHSLRRDFVLAPITALAFFTSPSGQRYLLVGEDTDIKVYEATTSGPGRLCCQFRVFSIQSIHGIRVRPRTHDDNDAAILVWGSQNVAVLPGRFIEDRLSNLQEAAPRVPETRAPDWIFDGILAHGADGRCFLVSAHNEVLEVTWEGQAQRRDPYVLRFGRVIYPARPALYSARIAWDSSDEELLVAGGTVFGEIMVWKCAVETGVASLLFVFAGHEGSIFGVDFSPVLERPDGSKGRLLASCSDDRTVRIWDVSEAAVAGGVAIGSGAFYEARETGFVGMDPDAVVSAVQDRTGASVAVAMGHASRIWNVRFGGPLGTSVSDEKLVMAVYSFGEDSTVWKWELAVDRPAWERRIALEASQPARGAEVAVLTHQETFSNHDGKHIWGCDLEELHTDDGETTTMIATGGADGRVNIIADTESPGFGKTTESPRQLETVVIKDLLDRLSPSPPQSGKRKKVTLHQFAHIAHNRILGVSNSGQLVLGTTGRKTTWEAVPLGDVEPSALAVSTIIQSPAPGLGLLGTTQKKLFLYRNGGIKELATLSGKVAHLFVVDGITPGDPRYHEDEIALKTVNILVVLIGAQDTMQLITLDLDTLTVTSAMAVPDQEPNYIATCARMLGPDVLAIGSRHGHVTLFKKTDAGLATMTSVDRRTEDTITSITPLPDSPLEDRFLFLTTSRDGNYRLYETHTPSDQKSTLTLLHETTSTATVTLEDAWFSSPSPSSRELILAGFRGKRFVVYNAALRLELAAIDCSGQHRSFTYRPLSASDPSTLRFAFNRASDLGLHAQRAAGFATPKHGTHGREIRAVAPGGRWIATGAEDTVIRLWEYSDGTQGVDGTARCVAAVKLHTAGLQALRWTPPAAHGGQRLFSCAGSEEFVVWHVRDVGASAFPGPAVVKEAVFADKTSDGDLRIMDFDVAAVTENDEGGFACLVSMAFSNSTIRTYAYSTAEGFRLVASARYTGACITKIELLREEDGVLEVLTAASDGHLAIWGVKLAQGQVVEYVPLLFVGVHQNGIKALGLRRDEKGYTVFTGGDDNSLVVTALARTAEDKWTIVSKRGVKRAHAAAVNGITVLPGGAAGSTTVATVSNDQRVKVWEIREEGISLLGDRNSAVADPGDIAVLESPGESAARIMVVGVGMEVWRFEHGRPESLSKITDEQVGSTSR
ncbi:WD domain-containing protein [Plectosphaerella cucumerina]|uniref:WD domain-containing protein n=1 Tax=Plectosphaerella cucumerina TaxID=40658 RepID=A0A8K0X7F7_9PEZI|nr:WD domain-containing protein [Plectosphaerella cucumerina]